MKRSFLRTVTVLAAIGISVLTAVSAVIYFGLDTGSKNVNVNTAAEQSQVQESLNCITEENTSEEMRGIWVPFMCLTLSRDEQNESSYTEKICGIMDRCVSCGLNTVIFQVRPFADALYPSEYYPWSHILTGTQGKDPGYDPLEIAVSEAHNRGLAIHAWINPLRISTGSTPPELSEDNPYLRNKNDSCRYFTYGDGIYFDPSNAEVRELIISGVREIVENYDVDGIQIDDYFYPTEDESIDAESYEKYKSAVSEGSAVLSHQEWRKCNINMLVCGMRNACHSTGGKIDFGISPQCNFDNNEKMAADIKSWCSFAGYADYICPQIYVSNEHPIFPFESLAEQWCDVMKNTGTKLYFGLGLYKVGTDADSGTWLTGEDIIRSQIASLRKRGVDGFILYSYEFIGNYSPEKSLA